MYTHTGQLLNEIIHDVSKNTNILFISKNLIKLTKSTDTALFLTHIILNYLSNNKNEWIPSTYKNWFNKLGIKEYKLRKIIKELKYNELVKTKIKKVNGNPTLHIKLNMEDFDE